MLTDTLVASTPVEPGRAYRLVCAIIDKIKADSDLKLLKSNKA